MQTMIIKSYRTGEVIGRRKLTKCAGHSVQYQVENTPRGEYMVIRDYYTLDKLQSFCVAKYGSFTFEVVNC